MWASTLPEVSNWSTDLFPHAHAEVARDWRPAGVHDLGAISVPGREAGVDHRAVRDSGCVLGCERDLPESHNRGLFGVIIAERE